MVRKALRDGWSAGHPPKAPSYKPWDPCFLPSSTLISFFLTRRVELTSLWSRLNLTESSDCSSSDCSRDWKKEGKDGEDVSGFRPRAFQWESTKHNKKAR